MPIFKVLFHAWTFQIIVKCISIFMTVTYSPLISGAKRFYRPNILNYVVSFLKKVLIGCAFLIVSACGETKDDRSISPPQKSAMQVRPYQLGDVFEFTGDVRISKRGEPIFVSAVSVLAELKPGRLHYQDKKVFTLSTITTFLATGERQIDTQDIWQESDGELFELSNYYGNEYVIGTVFEKGLQAIPIPLIASESHSIDFFTVYGGAASGPITEGKREISVDATQLIDTTEGTYQANKITHKESYKYLSTYVNNKRGTTVATVRELWISPDKGVVKKIEVRQVFSASGALLSESRWKLDITNLNF